MKKFFDNEQLEQATANYIENLTKAQGYSIGDKKFSQFGYTVGEKFLKIVYNVNSATRFDCVWCFVDKQGNIYKPAGWNARAKGIRGNVLTVNRYDGASLYRYR